MTEAGVADARTLGAVAGLGEAHIDKFLVNLFRGKDPGSVHADRFKEFLQVCAGWNAKRRRVLAQLPNEFACSRVLPCVRTREAEAIGKREALMEAPPSGALAPRWPSLLSEGHCVRGGSRRFGEC